MNIKQHIPNSLTLLNLLSGCLAVICLFLDYVALIPYFILFSLLADFLDGLVARALGVSSPIGKELDSLADVVSFGVLPAMVLVYLMAYELFGGAGGFNFAAALNGISNWQEAFMVFFPLIVALFSAYRLAKFNVSENQSKEFMGLATPAACLFVIGLLIIHLQDTQVNSFIEPTWLILGISAILSGLLVSDIPMFSFKLSGFSWKENKAQIIFLVFSAVLLLVFKLGAISLIVILYILINIFRSFFAKA